MKLGERHTLTVKVVPAGQTNADGLQLQVPAISEPSAAQLEQYSCADMSICTDLHSSSSWLK